MKKLFAVGDIHGEYDLLISLMVRMITTKTLEPERDVVVFLGDYVDRGSKTSAVVDQLITWEKAYPHWQFLYGNHEDLMLDALLYKGQVYGDWNLWWNQGGKETARSYFPKGMNKYDMAISQPEDHIRTFHINWLRKRPLFYETKDFFFVHAGIPNVPLKIIKKTLGEGLTDPVRQSMIWTREPFISSRYDWGKTIVFGHTSDNEGRYYSSKNPWGKNQKFMPIVKKNKIGIDTAPGAFNGRLTMLQCKPETEFFYEEHNQENS